LLQIQRQQGRTFLETLLGSIGLWTIDFLLFFQEVIPVDGKGGEVLF